MYRAEYQLVGIFRQVRLEETYLHVGLVFNTYCICNRGFFQLDYVSLLISTEAYPARFATLKCSIVNENCSGELNKCPQVDLCRPEIKIMSAGTKYVTRLLFVTRDPREI